MPGTNSGLTPEITDQSPLSRQSAATEFSIAENGRQLSFGQLNVRRMDVLRAVTSVQFNGAVTVSENGPGAPAAAFRVRSLGSIDIGGTVTATSADGLNIDMAAVDVNIFGNMQATGGISIRASHDLLISGVTITADSDGNGGILRLRGDDDQQNGGVLQAVAGSKLSGASVDLGAADVVLHTVKALSGDVVVVSGGSVTLNSTVISAAGSVVARANANILINDDVTAATTVELRADFDLSGTGLISQNAGTVSAASGVLSAAEGIDGVGGRGLPSGLTVSLGSLTAVNRASGNLRIVQTAAGGTLNVGLIRNLQGPVILSVLDGSLIDGNGADANIEAATADISVVNGSIGSAAGDIFRGGFNPLDVDIAGTLTLSAPDGFAVISGRMGGQVSVTAASAFLQSAGDIDLSTSAPVITNHLAVLSGGHVRIPDAGLAVTGDLRVEAHSISSQTISNPVVLGTAAARTDRLLLSVNSSATTDFQISADQLDANAESTLQLTLNGQTLFTDLNCDLTALNNPGRLTILQSTASSVAQGASRGTSVGTSMNDRMISGSLLLIGSSSFVFDHPENNVEALAAEVGGNLTYRDTDRLQITQLSGGPQGLSASGISTQDKEILLSTESGNLDLLRRVSSGAAKIGLKAGGNLTQDANARVHGAEAIFRAGDNISLVSASNDVSRVAFSSGNHAEIRMVGGLTLGDVSLSPGSLSGAAAGGFIDLRALSGDLQIESLVAASGSVLLNASGSVTQQTNASVRSAGLAVRAGGNVDLRDNGNSVGTFAAESGGTLLLTHVSALNVSTVTVNGLTLAGLTTSGADALIRTLSGGIQLEQAVNLGSGDLGLTSAASIQQSTSADIQAHGLAINAVGPVVLDNTGNLISQLAIDGDDNTTVRSGQTLTITAVNVAGDSISGITLASGDLNIRTTSGDIEVNDAVMLTSVTSRAFVFSAADVGINAAITAPARLTVIADADNNGSGSIRGNGVLQTDVGRLEAAEGIGNNAPIQTKMNVVSIRNTNSGSVRIQEVAAGGDLAIADIENVPGLVDLSVSNGSLLDGNADALNIHARLVSLTTVGGNIGTEWSPFFIQRPDTIEVNIAEALDVVASGYASAVSGIIGGEITGQAASLYVTSKEGLTFRTDAPSIANLALLADDDSSGTGTLTLADSLTVTDNLFLTGSQIVAADNSIDLAAKRLLLRSGSDVTVNVALTETATGRPGILDASAHGNLTIDLSTAAVLADLDGNNTALLTTTAAGSISVNAAGNLLTVTDDVISGLDNQATAGTGQINLSASTLRVQDAIISDDGDIELLRLRCSHLRRCGIDRR
ncbi:MAG UNVERIFIED_CONTAM: hypothetical protein LVR18_15820 [Planctomycetaceae bacterium]